MTITVMTAVFIVRMVIVMMMMLMMARTMAMLVQVAAASNKRKSNVNLLQITQSLGYPGDSPKTRVLSAVGSQNKT